MNAVLVIVVAACSLVACTTVRGRMQTSQVQNKVDNCVISINANDPAL